MTLGNYVSTATLALFISASVFAEEVPVIELGTGSVVNQNVVPVNNAASSQSEMVLILQQLQDEVRALRGQVEQQAYQIKQMERQQLDRYRDLDRRISAAAAPAQMPAPTAPVSDTASASTAAVSQPAASTSASAPGAAPATTPQASTSAPSQTDAQAYSAAFNLMRSGDYANAATAFSAFTKDYPQSDRLANAYYWLGEIHLAEQRPEQARESFMLVMTNFPTHQKAPDAAYKLGIVYDQLGDSKKSAEYLDLVISKYPDSSAVRLAKAFKRQK